MDNLKLDSVWILYSKRRSSAPVQHHCGAVDYYGWFVKQMKKLRAPKDYLLKKDTRRNLLEVCQISFGRFKSIVLSDLLLVHYGHSKEIIVTGDVSRNLLRAAEP